ncbi:MAG TPA: hypothetical protein PKE06_16210, partial [Flavilitoribacter sp.]|nr:hypothetical protein [Flavilitoribacter sp.]HMQ87711.1 hypothetical protein [Flavilitoribacter sp.]
QLVEQYTFNVWALGSNPSRITWNFAEIRSRTAKAFGIQYRRLFCFSNFLPGRHQDPGKELGLVHSGFTKIRSTFVKGRRSSPLPPSVGRA